MIFKIGRFLDEDLALCSGDGWGWGSVLRIEIISFGEIDFFVFVFCSLLLSGVLRIGSSCGIGSVSCVSFVRSRCSGSVLRFETSLFIVWIVFVICMLRSALGVLILLAVSVSWDFYLVCTVICFFWCSRLKVE